MLQATATPTTRPPAPPKAVAAAPTRLSQGKLQRASLYNGTADPLAVRSVHTARAHP